MVVVVAVSETLEPPQVKEGDSGFPRLCCLGGARLGVGEALCEASVSTRGGGEPAVFPRERRGEGRGVCRGIESHLVKGPFSKGCANKSGWAIFPISFFLTQRSPHPLQESAVFEAGSF